MEREQHADGLIELGAASVETKGPFGVVQDEALGIPALGLLDD